MQPLSETYVKWIKKLYKQNFSQGDISTITRVSKRTVERYCAKFRDEGITRFSKDFKE